MKTNTLVKFNFNGLGEEYRKKYPFSEKDIFVYLGDIVQMPEHCIVVRMEDGKVFCGYHTSNFVKIDEQDV